MDGKDHSGRPSGDGRLRKWKSVLNGVKGQRRIITFCKTHRSALLSGFFIVTIVLLLIGIFVQFQGPTVDDVPTGETPINYGAFLNQVNAGNVLAVTIRGDGVNALLLTPMAQPGVKPTRRH